MAAKRGVTVADVRSGALRLARMYPALRFEGGRVLDTIERVAAELGEDDGHVPVAATDPVVRVVDEPERRRLLRLAEHETNGSWARIRAAGAEIGCAGLDEIVVAGTAAASIADRRSPAAWIVRHAERADGFPSAAAPRLAIVISPESVWSIDEAYLARARSRRAGPLDFRWATGAGRRHVERLRACLEPVEACLPVEDAPMASAAFLDACTRARADREVAREAAECLLVAYVAGLEGWLAQPPSAN